MGVAGEGLHNIKQINPGSVPLTVKAKAKPREHILRTPPHPNGTHERFASPSASRSLLKPSQRGMNLVSLILKPNGAGSGRGD